MSVSLEGSSSRLSFEPDPVIEACKQGIDRSLLRENLKLPPEERLRELIESGDDRRLAVASAARRFEREPVPGDI